MSEEIEALRELAANRGCRLTRSRRRKAGGDHGRYGLKDAKTGREVFGFGPAGLTATADEIRDFLRRGGASTWRTSLGKGEAKQPEPKEAPARELPRPPGKPRRKPKAEAKKPAPVPLEPKLAIRDAKGRDAEAIAELIAALGYEVAADDIRRRLNAMAKAGQPALVAERGEVVGAAAVAVTAVLHRPRPVGRITMLVVEERERGAGVGTALAEEAARRLQAKGCGLIEVTSNMKRVRAHGFYERLGFERTSYRFVKPL